jgi:uncharacterized protein YjiS (DUF1127 family)
MAALLRRLFVPGVTFRAGPLRLAECVLKWQERARQRAMLASFDAHLLRDLGFTRAEVEREFRKPFWRS